MKSLAFRIGIKAGLITAVVILLFQASYLLLVYRYFKVEYYLAVVAVLFLCGGYYLAAWNIKKNKPAASPNPIKLLSLKEQQIFEHILLGKSNKEIAAHHFVELSTIKTHINHIYAKLAVSSRKELREKFGEQASL
jgi:DNA-binding NarL/FixJ family response regulator